jgi:outer membrane protein TolC
MNWLFRRGADRGAGRAIIARARADSSAMMAKIGAEVRRAFFGALAQGRLLGLATEQRILADSLRTIADRRFDLGDISALERDQVALEADRARQAESVALEEAGVATATLARSVGYAGADGLVPHGELEEGLGAESPPGPVGDAIPPLLAGALADSAEAAARLRSARLAQVPPLTLRTGQESGGESFVTKSFVGFSIGVPIFSRGREAVAEAAGFSSAAEGLAAEARLDLQLRSESARVRLEQAERRAIIARDSLAPRAARIRAGTVRLYEQGRIAVLPVFDAIRAERDVVRGMVDALVAYQNARADLLELQGRWQ